MPPACAYAIFPMRDVELPDSLSVDVDLVDKFIDFTSLYTGAIVSSALKCLYTLALVIRGL